MCAKSLQSCPAFCNLWTIAHQATLSMGLPRKEHQSGLPCPPPGGLPNPGTERVSFASPALARRFFTPGATWEAPISCLSLLPNDSGRSRRLEIFKQEAGDMGGHLCTWGPHGALLSSTLTLASKGSTRGQRVSPGAQVWREEQRGWTRPLV